MSFPWFTDLLRRLRAFRLGVRQRVVFVLFTGLLISLSVSSWLIMQELAQQSDSEILARGQQLTTILSRALTNHVVSYDYHSIQLFLDEVIQSPHIAHVKVLSAKGNLMAEAQAPQYREGVPRYFEEPIRVKDKTIGMLVVGLDTANIVAQIAEQKSKLIIREIGVIVFILVLELIALSWLIIKPLAIISATIQKNAGDSTGMIPDDIPLKLNNEFGDIAKQYNEMRDKLNNATLALQGKIESTDAMLREANVHLLNKSYELEKVNQTLQKQTLTDPLTGLPNRRDFQEVMGRQLPELLAHGKNLAALLIDIDYFKKINDQYGHVAGDIVLRTVAARLVSNLRKSDRIFRIGGEEFFIVCVDTGEEQISKIGEKLRRCIDSIPVIVHNDSVNVTVSIGIASLNDSSLNHSLSYQDQIGLLYRQTDAALHFSKSTNRNSVSHFSNLPLDKRQKLTG